MPDLSDSRRRALRQWGIPSIFLLHLILHMGLGWAGSLNPWNLFNLLLLAANAVLALRLARGWGEPLEGLGMMLAIAGQGLVGNQLVPDALTGGSMLVVNLLNIYVGLRIFRFSSRAHQAAFLASLGALFFIFIHWLPQAEPLFLLALMGLAATARNLKLLAFFWILILSFTLAQPFAWESILLASLLLVILFSARGALPSAAALIFLGLGLIFVFFVLFPVSVLLLGESPYNWMTLLQNPHFTHALGLSAATAAVSALILAIAGIPLAYALSRLEFKGKALLLSLIDLPVVIPQSVAGIALLSVFGKQQIFGGFLFHAFGFRFDGTVLGILLAQIFVAMPFLLKGAMAAFEAVPQEYETAARTLGANSWSAFQRIALPLAGRGLFLSTVLAFARAAGEFGAVFFIAAYPETAPVAVYNRFISSGLAETAPYVSGLLLFSLAMFFLLQWSARLMPRFHGRGGRS